MRPVATCANGPAITSVWAAPQTRPFLRVSQAMRDGAPVPGFQLSNAPTIFPTKVAAVEAGCAAKNAGQATGSR